MSADLADRLARLEQRIVNACAQCGRDRASVQLLAVSKKKPPEMIRAAFELGLRDFGENYAQELRDKATALAAIDQLSWHFIGPLQRNKAQYIVGRTALLHTVDNAALVDRIEQLAGKQNLVQHVLVQLNLSGETTKSGIAAGQLDALLAHIANKKNVRCVGLMTMPPLFDDPSEAAPVFAELRQLRDKHNRSGSPATLAELSMGMSHDFEIAIKEGATIIRVGSAIFGQR